jgi:hypothetical protein
MMQAAIAFLCLGTAGVIVGYTILVAYAGWKVLIVPVGLTIAVLMVLHYDRKKHGPM